MSTAPGIQWRWHLQVGETTTWDGSSWRIMAYDGEVVTLVGDEGRRAQVHAEELCHDFPVPRSSGADLIDIAPPHERRRAYELERHILEVENGKPDDARYAPDLKIKDRVENKLLELNGVFVDGECLKMAPSVFHEYRRRYRQPADGGGGVNGLVRRTTTRVQQCVLDDHVQLAVQAVIAELRSKSKITFDAFYWRVENWLEENPPEDGRVVKLPPLRTLREYVKRTPAGRYTFTGRTRTKRNDSFQGAAFAMPATLFPGDKVEFDGTRANFKVRFPDRTLGRPWLSGAIDVATGSLLAGRLSQEEKGVDCALLLFDMVTPTKMVPGWDERLRFDVLMLGIEELVQIDALFKTAAARPVIVPRIAVTDLGKVYVGDNCRRGFAALGTTHVLARNETPTDKPNIERANDTLQTTMFQHLPVAVGRDVSERGEDRSLDEEDALTLAEAQAALDLAIIGWQFQPSKGLQDPFIHELRYSPNQAWRNQLGGCGFIPRPIDPQLMYRLLPVVPRKVTPQGIQIDYRFYDTDALGPYRGRPSAIPAHPDSWIVRQDPRNITRVFFYDHRENKHIPVPWKMGQRIIGQPMADSLWRAARAHVSRGGGNSTDEYDVTMKVRDLLLGAGYIDGPARRALRKSATDSARAVRDHEAGGVGPDEDDLDEGWGDGPPAGRLNAYFGDEQVVDEGADDDDGFTPFEYDPAKGAGQ